MKQLYGLKVILGRIWYCFMFVQGLLKREVLSGRSKIAEGRCSMDIFSLGTFILYRYISVDLCTCYLSVVFSPTNVMNQSGERKKVGQWPVLLLTSWETGFLSSACLHSYCHLSGCRVPLVILLKEVFFLSPAPGTEPVKIQCVHQSPESFQALTGWLELADEP